MVGYPALLLEDEGAGVTAPRGLVPGPHWKVRVALPGSLLHLASATEPRPLLSGGRLVGCELESLEDETVADTLGYLDWSAVLGLSWRYAEEPAEELRPASAPRARAGGGRRW